MLSSSSLCPLLPTLSAPWRRQTAARAKQTRLIGTQTPLIKCWLCLGCFVIIRAVFINRDSHSNFLAADSCLPFKVLVYFLFGERTHDKSC